jgi:sugar/nucleoside kinase (ribokinase family)
VTNPRFQGTRRGIVTGGTWCVDHNRVIEFWPAEDAVAEILSDEMQGGGSACNLAIDMRKLASDLPVETIGLVGDDSGGRFLLDQAEIYGIRRCQLIVAKETTTQFAEAYTSRLSGRRTHIFRAGASSLLAPDDFDLGSTTARILHLGLPGVHKTMDRPYRNDPNGWVTVLRRARDLGIVTNLELASIAPERLAPLVLPCLPHLNLLIVNDMEIGVLADRTTVVGGKTDVKACIEAARSILERGKMESVVVHFPVGAVAATRHGSVIMYPSVNIPPEEVIGTNGAGDAFAAGFLYGYHENWPLERCLVLAHAAAAVSLRSVSTTGAMESWETCLAHATRWGFRDRPLDRAAATEQHRRSDITV